MPEKLQGGAGRQAPRHRPAHSLSYPSDSNGAQCYARHTAITEEGGPPPAAAFLQSRDAGPQLSVPGWHIQELWEHRRGTS